jgi:hypothetical protein
MRQSGHRAFSGTVVYLNGKSLIFASVDSYLRPRVESPCNRSDRYYLPLAQIRTRLWSCVDQEPCGQEHLMNNVLKFRRRGASREVIDKFVKLGYLERALRRNAGAIENALARLQEDLCRSRAISESHQLDSYRAATIGKFDP